MPQSKNHDIQEKRLVVVAADVIYFVVGNKGSAGVKNLVKRDL